MKLAPLVFFTVLFTIGFAVEVEAANPNSSIVFETDELSILNGDQKHNVSMELLGRAGFYSFNYDYAFMQDLVVGAGLSAFSLYSGESSVSTRIIPVYSNYYLNNGRSRLFATVGADLILVAGNVSDSNQIKGSGIAGSIGIGYEYKSQEGFLFRTTPYLMLGQIQGAWIGVSLGYSI